MSTLDVVLLLVGGAVAGVMNTLAGGGSLLTVPLLVLAGVPGNVANGSNRVGVMAQTISSILSFRRLGISGIRRALPVLVPVAMGSLIGALVISRLTDDAFERIFGFVMIPMLLLALRKPRLREVEPGAAWTRAMTVAVFFAVGIYGGAFQVGVGLFLIMALSYSGFELVVANAIKVVVNFAVTALALPVFILNDQVDWGPALVLAVGLATGGWIGAHLTVKGGEPVIRAAMVVAVLALAGRLIGLY